MIRNIENPRHGWEDIVSGQGLIFHTIDGEVYWDERASYSFSSEAIDMLDDATNELHGLCLEAVEHVIKENLFQLFGVTPQVAEMIRWSWEQGQTSIYGRFDLAFDGVNPPQMLEYNADTPTSLLEASVIQWFWLQDVYPQGDQFNSIHEKLVAAWKKFKPKLNGQLLHFGCADTHEDIMNTTYLEGTAQDAGIMTRSLDMCDIGWDSKQERFVDTDDEPIHTMFKLYPWEWLMKEKFAQNLLQARNETQWLEPAWKMLLSNKALLPILWELFPGHPNLLESYFDNPHNMRDYVRKPLLSREGANVEIFARGLSIAKTEGDYGDGAFVCQKRAVLPEYEGNYPIIGSWVIDGQAAGIGVRESESLITGNTSRFIPHRID